MNELLIELDNAINEVLDNCSAENTPTVCSMIATKRGRKDVFKLIRNLVVSSGFTIAESVKQIEMTYNINLID